ncbi:MAG: extracellular solute-binding protein, partial [Clostridia bacterium]
FDVKELSDLQNWIEQGYVDSLESYVAADSYDLTHYLGMEKYYRGADAQLYALPYRSDFWVLFYNKTLFDKAGIACPTNDMTWDQYADLALQMTSGEGIDKIYGTHYHTWLSAVANWAVNDGVYTLADGNYEPLKYFYSLCQNLEDKGACQEFSELKAANLHYSAAFYQGNVAMMPMGYWFAATLIAEKAKSTFDFDWSFVSVPHKEDVAAGTSFGSLTGTCINKNAVHKDAAWKFINWRCSEAGAQAIAAVGTRPGYVSDAIAATMASAEGFPADDAAKAALVPTGMGIEWPVGSNVSEIKTIVNEEHSLIMTRELSIDDGIAEMTERVAQVLGK